MRRKSFQHLERFPDLYEHRWLRCAISVQLSRGEIQVPPLQIERLRLAQRGAPQQEGKQTGPTGRHGGQDLPDLFRRPVVWQFTGGHTPLYLGAAFIFRISRAHDYVSSRLSSAVMTTRHRRKWFCEPPAFLATEWLFLLFPRIYGRQRK